MAIVHVRCWPVLLVLAPLFGLVAQSDPPPRTFCVRYTLRLDPNDSASPARLRLVALLESVHWSPTAVDWRLLELCIIEPALDPAVPPIMWLEDHPPAVTWRVAHRDVRSPSPAEFNTTPLFRGRAQAVTHDSADLDYSFKARPPTPLPPQPAMVPRATVDYWLQLADDTQPQDSGQGLPADIEGRPDFVDLTADPPTGW